jgi:ketosteroid isomerase-like protein
VEDLSENARIAVRGAKALSDRDPEAMMEVAHPEIEFVTHPGFVGQAPTYRGHDGVRRWLKALEPWEAFQVDVEEVIDISPDTVVVVSHVTARGSGSGVDVEMRTYDVVTIVDGKIRKRRHYETREDALEAARGGGGSGQAAGVGEVLGTRLAAGRPSPLTPAGAPSRCLLMKSSMSGNTSRATSLPMKGS